MLKRWHVLFMLLYFEKVLQSHTEGETSKRISIRQTDATSSCSNGWFSFGNKCYKLGGKNKVRRLPWDQASERCREEYKGTLVTVDSKELSEFLVAFLLVSEKENLWIGLHDRINESVYTWDDGTPVTQFSYLNWEPNQPRADDHENEDCVEMIHHTLEGITGQWNNLDCSVNYQFICQKEKGKFNKDYLDPRLCPTEIGGGWKRLTSCFHIVDEKKTWSDAEKHCVQKYKGHLATITDFPVDIFVNYILKDIEKSVWIGIRTKNEYQQQWSSGWYVSYEKWAQSVKPDELEEGLCVARNHEGKWVIHSCSEWLPFICEYSTDKPPILKPTIKGGSCPDVPADWRDLGGDYCYYIEPNYVVNWYEANFLCIRRGGNLLILHSHEESRLLQNFLMYMISNVYYKHHAVYIGLYRHIKHDEEFVWIDGSPLTDFVNWGVNEPNTEKEQCGELISYTLKWNDIGCGEKRGYICSVLKVSSNQTYEQCPNQTIVQCPNHTIVQCPNQTIVHSTPSITSNQTYEQYTNQTIVHSTPDSTPSCGHSTSVLAGVVICVLFVSVLVGVIVFYFCFHERKYGRMKKNSDTKLQSQDKKLRYRSEIVICEDDLYADMI